MVGAAPWRQQIALIVGVIAGSLVIPPTLDLLNQAYGFPGDPNRAAIVAEPLSAPQALLISTLARGVHTVDTWSAFFCTIHQDPVLQQVKLIAEPWDTGTNGYQVGNFPFHWSEWNDKYREAVRKFWREEPAALPDLPTRLDLSKLPWFAARIRRGEMFVGSRLPDDLPEEALQAIARRHPLGLGAATDLVGAYAYLASDASRWTTGSALVVDGGYSAP